MKQYVANRHLRIVGKGWEVRHQLRKLAAAHGDGAALLAEYTGGRPPVRVRLGASDGARAAVAVSSAAAASGASQHANSAPEDGVNCSPPA